MLLRSKRHHSLKDKERGFFNKKGFFSRDNREFKGKLLRVELGNGGRKKRTEGCFTCGSLDHIARDCDKNPSRKREREMMLCFGISIKMILSFFVVVLSRTLQ